MQRATAPAIVTMALVALSGCNAVFGLDPVSLRDAGPEDTGAGGASGLVACSGGGGFDSSVILNGDIESTEPDQVWTAESIGSVVTSIDACEGAHALRIKGWYQSGGRVYNDVTAMPFIAAPCIDFSFWARAPAGDVIYRIWITLNAEGPTGYAFNDLAPPEGFIASSASWTRVAGRCRAQVPDVIHGFSQVSIRADKDQTVDIDALAAFAVACTGDEMDCPVPPP